MIYPKSSITHNAINAIHYGRRDIRNVYRNVNGVMRKLFSADLIYFGVSRQGTVFNFQVVKNWKTIVARVDFGPIKVSVPTQMSTVAFYLHLYIPKYIADKATMFQYGNYLDSEKVKSSQTFLIDEGEETERSVVYNCYTILMTRGSMVITTENIKQDYTQITPIS